MEIIQTMFDGVKLIRNFSAQDPRGSFVKIYNSLEYQKAGLRMEFRESYYSVSGKDTIRGMHFQTPPYDHGKLVHVLSGAVRDVVLDLRRSSDSYGKCMEIRLCGAEPYTLYIPSGFAHGFQSLEEQTVMMYYVTCGYAGEHDAGIRWNSIPYKWDVTHPVVSERDRSLPLLQEFETPFL